MSDDSEIKCGIYMLYQTSSDKGYVGSTNNFDRRLKYHLNELEKNNHPNLKLQRAYNKDPNFEIIKAPIPDRQLAFDCEQVILDSHMPKGKLFNLSSDARYCKGEGPMPEETRKKISESNKGKQNFLGKKHSDETKQKMSSWQIGKKHSSETIEKLKEKAVGRKPSQAAIDAAREVTKGKPPPVQALARSNEVTSKPVNVAGVTYTSLSEAARAHDITPATAHNRINKSLKFPEWKYED